MHLIEDELQSAPTSYNLQFYKWPIYLTATLQPQTVTPKIEVILCFVNKRQEY